MKLIILLALAGLSSSAKLDNTYLPPSHATTSGGSSDFLRTPSQPVNLQTRGFGNNAQNIYNSAPGSNFVAHSNSFAPNINNAAPKNFDPTSNNYALTSNNFAPSSDNFQTFEAPKYQERAQAAFERNAAILRLDNQNDGESFSYAYDTENGISAEEHGVATNGVEAQGGFSYTGDDGQVYSIRYTADQNGFVPQGDHLPTPPPIPEEILQALQMNAQDEAAGIFDDGSYNDAKYNSGDINGYNNANNYNHGNGNQNYQPSTEAVNDEDTVVTTNALFRNQPAGFNNQGAGNQDSNQSGHSYQGNSGITQAYLPPFGKMDNQPSLRYQQPSYNNQQPSLKNQQPAFEKQNIKTPFNISPFGRQTPSGNQHNNQGFPGSRSNQYLPPFDSQRSPNNQMPLNNRNPGFRSQEIGNANKAYLPPRRR